MPRNRRAVIEEVPEVEEDEVDTNDIAEEEEMDFSITRRPATHLDELFPVEDEEDNEEGEDAEGIPDVGSSSAKPNKRKSRSKKPFPTLPNPPPFDNIFLHAKPAHTGHPKLPLALLLDKALPPLDIFSLFFSTSVLESIASNTNAYAELKDAGANEGSRKWKEATAEELRIFFGIIVYLGVFVPRGPVEDLWSTSPHFPQHDISKFMTVHRFQQLKRFLHVSSPHESDEHWYSKLEPLSSKLSKDFSTFYIPSTDVSVDEMIVRFSGRSSHTVKMKCKPTPEGYKIYALCEAGYTFSFLYYSRVASVIGVTPIDGLSPTSAAVVGLAKALPYETHPFNIYMDNFFSNVNLFKHLRELKIGACGTARATSKHFPSTLKVDKKMKLEWDTLSGEVVDDSVLAIVWVDNAPVPMLSTIHNIIGEDARIPALRRRPRTTSTNAEHTRARFSGQPTAILDIPRIINDYNHKMNGVDLSDQYRSYYSTQLTVCRTWMPLFFWILDITIVNSYRIYKTQGGTLSHKDFRITLAWALVSEGNTGIRTPKTRHHHKQQEAHAHSHKLVYVTKSRNELPALRFANKGDHCPEKVDDSARPNCILCRHKATVLGDKTCDVKTPTTWICGFCKVPLCLSKTRNCYKEYHGF